MIRITAETTPEGDRVLVASGPAVARADLGTDSPGYAGHAIVTDGDRTVALGWLVGDHTVRVATSATFDPCDGVVLFDGPPRAFHDEDVLTVDTAPHPATAATLAAWLTGHGIPATTETAPTPAASRPTVTMVDPSAWAPFGEADVRPCTVAGEHRRTQRHPRSVCPLHVPGTPMGE